MRGCCGRSVEDCSASWARRRSGWWTVGLVIVEVLATSGFFLSFAASALMVAAKAAVLGASLLTDVLIFAVLGVLLVSPLRTFLRRFLDRTKDINDL